MEQESHIARWTGSYSTKRQLCRWARLRREFTALILLCLAGGMFIGCSGQERSLKALAAPRGLMLLDGGLEPSVPEAFERATAWTTVRDAAEVKIWVAFVDTTTAQQADFVPSLELFSEFALSPSGPEDIPGVRRYEGELPPRPESRILYYYFEARDDDGQVERLPSTSPDGAVAVGTLPFEIQSPRPEWSAPFEPLACWADLARYNPDFAGGSPSFDVLADPIWVTNNEAVILSANGGFSSGIGAIVEGQPYFYPLNIMLWNEVANARQGQTNTVMTYCPLTDSAVLFTHDDYASGAKSNWKTTGIYNSNLIVKETRGDQSNIPQLLAFGISGQRYLQCIDVLPSFLCNYGFWFALHPDTKVLNGDRGLRWNWLTLNNPYVSYWTDDQDIRAGLANVDEEHPLNLQNKSIVVGVIGETETTVYPIHRNVPFGSIAYNDDGGTRPMVLFWVRNAFFAAVFDRRLPSTGELLSFHRTAASFHGTPLFEDDQIEPSLWTVEGLAIAGPLTGTQLAWLPSTRVFWFAWHATYPNARIVDLPVAEN